MYMSISTIITEKYKNEIQNGNKIQKFNKINKLK